MRRLRVAILSCLFFCGPLYAFSLNTVTSIGTGQRFQIHSQGKVIGEGQMLELSATHLRIAFSARPARFPVEGRVALQMAGRRTGGQTFQLKYEGKAAGQKEAGQEIVEVPYYLLRKGIISFSYKKGERFFQLSRNARGETILITDWGAARLSAKKAGSGHAGLLAHRLPHPVPLLRFFGCVPAVPAYDKNQPGRVRRLHYVGCASAGARQNQWPV